MRLTVDPTDPTPVYQQIRRQVSRMVASGTLVAGQRLPTIRQLSADLGVAKGTVAKAYDSLFHDGIVASSGRHGTVVADTSTPDPQFRDAEVEHAAAAFALVISQAGVGVDAAMAALRAAVGELDRDADGVPAEHQDEKSRP